MTLRLVVQNDRDDALLAHAYRTVAHLAAACEHLPNFQQALIASDLVRLARALDPKVAGGDHQLIGTAKKLRESVIRTMAGGEQIIGAFQRDGTG